MVRERIFLWFLLLMTAVGMIYGGEAGAIVSSSGKVSASDPNSQYMAVGRGNTLQIYDLQRHQLHRTLSLPTSVNDKAEIRALAVNPVSFVIAVGGRSQDLPGGKMPLYLYGNDGRLYARITDLPGQVGCLAFSPDGAYLAVSTVEERSLQLFQMKELSVTYSYTIHPDLSQDEKEALKQFSEIEDVTMNPERIFRDLKIPGDITAMAFLADGRLVTGSSDGTVRLYDAALKLIKTSQIEKGGHPDAISVMADGSRMAITFSDNQRVDILSAKDLTHLYSPDSARFSRGKLESVSWSSDGSALYSIGREKEDGTATVGRWSEEGKGRYKELSAAPATTKDMTALKGGGVAFVESDRQISVLDKRYGSIQNERFTVWTSVGAKFGDVTYQIGGHYIDVQGGTEGEDHFPISELKWPINAMMGEIGGEWRIGQHWEVRGSAFHNLTNSFSGKMEDSDWITNTNIEDVYSESSVDFEGYGVDAGVRYWLMDRQYREAKSFSLGIGAGFTYHKYSWDGCNTNQWSPSGAYPGAVATAGGIVIQYESRLSMPYLELAFKSKLDRFELSGSVGGSPYVMTSDRDNHLFRDRVSWGEANGWAFKLSVDGLYTFANNWFAGGHFGLLYYTTDGTLEEIDTGALAYILDQKIISKQFDIMFKIGKRF